MREDFHNFTSLDQFDQTKINHFARLDAIPGFCLLRSEKEYLECYRTLLRREPDLRGGDINNSIYLDKEASIEEDKKVEPRPAPKKTHKTTKTEAAEE